MIRFKIRVMFRVKVRITVGMVLSVKVRFSKDRERDVAPW